MLYKRIVSQWDDDRAFAFVARAECLVLHRMGAARLAIAAAKKMRNQHEEDGANRGGG